MSSATARRERAILKVSVYLGDDSIIISTLLASYEEDKYQWKIIAIGAG
jgi:hypothetical protein